METISINNDIKVFFIEAGSFPAGIKAAFENLQSLLPTLSGRNFFGISYGNQNGNITYLAAAEESFPGEGAKYNCPEFTIRKGEYLSETIYDWRNDMSAIGKLFQKMLSDQRVDKNGYCVEKYINDKDVVCMVTLSSPDN